MLRDFTWGFRFGCVTDTITNPNAHGDSNPDSNTYPHAYDLLLRGFCKRQ